MRTTSEEQSRVQTPSFLLTQLRCRRVLVLAGEHSSHVRSKCLFRFEDPVSPHLAARRANESGSVEVCLQRFRAFSSF